MKHTTIEKYLRYGRFMQKHKIPIDFNNLNYTQFIRHMDYRERVEKATPDALKHEWKVMKMFLRAYHIEKGTITDINKGITVKIITFHEIFSKNILNSKLTLMASILIIAGEKFMLNKHKKKIIKNIHQPIAFVLGSYITGLGVIRSLGRKHIPVISLDSAKHQIGFYSKYCNGIKSPHPQYEEEAYIDFLLEIGELLNNKGVLIPTSDLETLAILKNKPKLIKHYNFIMSDLSISELLINKSLFYKTLKKLNIGYPKTYYPKDEKQVLELSKKVKYPCAIKPIFSIYFRLEFDTKLFIANSQKELIMKWKKANKRNHEVLLQEIVPGDTDSMYGLNMYYRKGFTPRNVFMYQRIREWPHDFGNGCIIRKTNIPELEKIVIDLVSKINYHGIIDAEFKRDKRDNSFKSIEINARPWMQNSLASRYGLDAAYFAYMDAIGKNVEKQYSSKEDIKWVILSDDVCSSLKKICKKELTYRQWIKSYKGKKIYAFFACDDPLPFAVFMVKSLFNFSFLDILRCARDVNR